jgi:hypothetical protein
MKLKKLMKLKTDVIGEQGLAALALEKFAKAYEIEGEVKRKQGLAALALEKFAKAYEIEGGSRPGIGGWLARTCQLEVGVR